MDPQACLAELLEAVRDCDLDLARERLFDLATWIEKGGFCPLVTPSMVEKIIERRREMIGEAPPRYRLHLVCPRCDKESETIVDRIIPNPRINCGDCLMERTEVVEMKIISAEQEGVR